MPIDELYGESTKTFLDTANQVTVPIPRDQPSTGIGSILRATGRGLGQGGASLGGAISDLTAAASQVYQSPEMQFGAAINPEVSAALDRQMNDAISKGKAGTLVQSRLGSGFYDLADTFKPNPNDTTRADQIVQGAVSGLTQIVPAAIVAGPAGAAVVGGTSIGMGRAEELKREGVDVATRSKVGAVSGAMAGVGAVIPVGGSGLASTTALVGVGGPGMAIAQGAAEKAILKNADYGHLADQIDPLDPVNLAAATLMAGAFGGVHLAATRRAAAKAGVPASAGAPVAPAAAPDLTSMAVEARKGLRYNDPSIDAYAVQAAQREGVPPALMLALKNAGEKSGPTAVSPKGAAGVAQLMPENQAKFGITDAADPVQSLDGMAKYLAATMKQYDGNIQAVIADYNGGPRQATAVLRGERPPAAETQAYMDRVNMALIEGRAKEIAAAKFNPTPDEVDAAFSAQGRRIVDEANPFGMQDVAGMSTHQDLVEYAAKMMDSGQFPDITRYISETDALRAQSLEGLIADAESRYTSMSARAADLADPGMVRQLRAELEELQARVPGESDVQALTKQLQQQGAKFKKARSDAQKQVDAQRADFEARMQRLRDQIDQNALAQQAAGDLPGLTKRLADLRAQREAIDLPPQRKTPIAQFVEGIAKSWTEESARPLVSSAKSGTLESGKSAGTPAPENLPAAPKGTPQAAEGGNPAADSSNQAGAVAAVDANLRETLTTAPDTRVHLDANDGEFNGTLTDAMRLIDEEHTQSMADAKLLDVAANCFISLGA